MISVIICSRTEAIDEVLKKNIDDTIGVEHEIISIDNHLGSHSIFQAYNLGVQRAKYPYLCFMHDDVRHHTPFWGEKIINHFKDEKVGMLGVGGTTYLPVIPGIWWGVNSDEQTYSTRQYSLDTDRNNLTNQHTTYNNPLNETVSDVVALDGLFFCVRKELFEVIGFDENYGGYHFYDLDISMQVLRAGFRLQCIYDILIEHISASNLNTSWINSSRVFFDKWHKMLPVSSRHYDKDIVRQMERSNLQVMLNLLYANHISPFSYFSFEEILYIALHQPQFIAGKICKRIAHIQ